MFVVGELLVAESLAELAICFEAAADAGDKVERLRVVELGRARRLDDDEFARLLELASATHLSGHRCRPGSLN